MNPNRTDERHTGMLGRIQKVSLLVEAKLDLENMTDEELTARIRVLVTPDPKQPKTRPTVEAGFWRQAKRMVIVDL